MNSVDYDRALYYMYRNEWDNLMLLMVRTKDDFLSKKIEHFLHAFHFEHEAKELQHTTDSLFEYLDHALDIAPIDVSTIADY
ncbi:YhdB family protein [Bacillus tianshenii]|nr:YhdB family protein [Bacillus tianshenii]